MNFISKLKEMSENDDRTVINKTESLTVINVDNNYIIKYSDIETTESKELKRCNAMLRFVINTA